MSDYETTRNFHYMIIGGLILVIIAIFIGMLAILHHLSSPPPRKPGMDTSESVNKDEVNKKYGRSNSIKHFKVDRLDKFNCSMPENNTEWNDTTNSCMCKVPYYEYKGKCKHQLHDSKYFHVGHLDPGVTYSKIKTIQTPYKSFHSESCSKQCDNDKKCIGFVYEGQKCELLSQKLVLDSPSRIINTVGGEASLYMLNHEKNIVFTDYVSVTSGRRSYKYWTTEHPDHIVHVKRKEKVYKLNFFPTKTIQEHLDTDGVYSPHHFTKEGAELLLKLNNGPTKNIYIHKRGTALNLPKNWIDRTTFYVYYQ